MMDIKPIHTNADYDEALARIAVLMGAENETQQGDELDVLVTLVESYEHQNFPMESPDPVEFLKNVMEFVGEDQTGLGKLINSRPRASEILNRRRPLTLNQIRRIVSVWRVPAEPLIREYEISK